jgi:hypothetical protein
MITFISVRVHQPIDSLMETVQCRDTGYPSAKPVEQRLALIEERIDQCAARFLRVSRRNGAHVVTDGNNYVAYYPKGRWKMSIEPKILAALVCPLAELGEEEHGVSAACHEPTHFGSDLRQRFGTTVIIRGGDRIFEPLPEFPEW